MQTRRAFLAAAAAGAAVVESASLAAGAQHENLDLEADGAGRSLTDLANYVIARAR